MTQERERHYREVATRDLDSPGPYIEAVRELLEEIDRLRTCSLTGTPLILEPQDVVLREVRNGWIAWAIEEGPDGRVRARACVRHADSNAPDHENPLAAELPTLLWEAGLEHVFRSKHVGGLEFEYRKRGRG